MKRVLTVLTIFAAAAMLNGCTKCSQERPAEPPPVMEPPTGTPPPTEGEAVPEATPAPDTTETATPPGTGK